MTSQIDDHSDKYNDPRARITRRGVLIGISVVFIGIAGSALSIWARRTKLEKSTEFWGDDVILAFQLAEEVELIRPSDSDPVRLSGMPGLGHLRHVLLDERSYRWESVNDTPMKAADEQQCLTLQFRDPSVNRFPDTQIIIQLDTGWLGNASGSQRVQLTERYQTAMGNYLKQISAFEPIRSENRKADPPGGQ